MNVDIHLLRGQGDVENRQRVTALRNEGVVGLADRKRQGRVLDPAMVDEKDHIAPVGAVERRRPTSPHTVIAVPLVRVLGYVQHLLGNVQPVQREDNIPHLAGARCPGDQAIVAAQLKTALGESQRVTADEAGHVACLGDIGPQEPEPGRRVVEQILHQRSRCRGSWRRGRCESVRRPRRRWLVPSASS